MGCDTFGRFIENLQRVSIHAPVWGATGLFKLAPALLVFQSTHPCGVRPSGLFKINDAEGFNPRTRVGCDKFDLELLGQLRFQSTHPCGVRLFTSISSIACQVSIHAPVWGATKPFWVFILQYKCFNPRTRVGCDAGLKK